MIQNFCCKQNFDTKVCQAWSEKYVWIGTNTVHQLEKHDHKVISKLKKLLVWVQ